MFLEVTRRFFGFLTPVVLAPQFSATSLAIIWNIREMLGFLWCSFSNFFSSSAEGLLLLITRRFVGTAFFFFLLFRVSFTGACTSAKAAAATSSFGMAVTPFAIIQSRLNNHYSIYLVPAYSFDDYPLITGRQEFRTIQLEYSCLPLISLRLK